MPYLHSTNSAIMGLNNYVLTPCNSNVPRVQHICGCGDENCTPSSSSPSMPALQHRHTNTSSAQPSFPGSLLRRMSSVTEYVKASWPSRPTFMRRPSVRRGGSLSAGREFRRRGSSPPNEILERKGGSDHRPEGPFYHSADLGNEDCYTGSRIEEREVVATDDDEPAGPVPRRPKLLFKWSSSFSGRRSG
ncbi:hypothetical protein B0O99DRAFT_624264 [Bisporella sp. PMI_857]|nr:hypothetical protein B0O99DRAFT_624264 [Bisporella sp. PMI_857]